jgi:uncharacterized membrane protein
MRIEHQLDIEAPPSVVFALTIDIERWPTLTPTVTSVERLDDGPLRVGSRARLKQPGQRPTVWTVTTIEPDRLFAWSATAFGMRMTATHLIAATSTGTSNTLRIDLSGWSAPIVGRLGRGKLQQTLATENDGFRREARSVRQSGNTA